MEGWQIGLIVMMAAGFAVIVFGALWDRARNQQREHEMLSPPPRTIPEFRPEAAPRYLSEVEARRTHPDSGIVLDDATRRLLRERVGSGSPIDSGYASRDFVTDRDTGWAVLHHPRVLVCAQPVTTFRELLGPLEVGQTTGEALVIVAPEFDREVMSTLEVNRVQHRARLLAVQAGDAVRAAVVEECGALSVDALDLRAGYVPEAAYGKVEWWISDDRHSWLVDEMPSFPTANEQVSGTG